MSTEALDHRLLRALLDTAADLAPLATALLEAWDAARGGRRDDFPLRTFRWLMWRPDRPHDAAVRAALST